MLVRINVEVEFAHEYAIYMYPVVISHNIASDDYMATYKLAGTSS